MRLALKELKYHRRKYFLIEMIVILLMFMVLFLSGLVRGLGLAVSSGVESMPAANFVLSEDAEKLITVSTLEPDVLTRLQNKAGLKAVSIDIQRLYIEKKGSDEKLDIVYFAVDPADFLAPAVTEGKGLTHADQAIVLDDDFKAEGIAVGDTIRDAASGRRLKVTGFVKDKMYGHVSVGYISRKTYAGLMAAQNPGKTVPLHAVAVQGSAAAIKKANVPNVSVLSKATVVDNLPGYRAEQMTITMVVWLLLVITAVIIGVFFYIINLQREKEFGVMKAIGLSLGELVCFIVFQVLLTAAIGAAIADGLVALMARALPATMPFYLLPREMAAVSVIFVGISLIGSLASVVRVAKVDPMAVIGGENA